MARVLVQALIIMHTVVVLLLSNTYFPSVQVVYIAPNLRVLHYNEWVRVRHKCQCQVVRQRIEVALWLLANNYA